MTDQNTPSQPPVKDEGTQDNGHLHKSPASAPVARKAPSRAPLVVAMLLAVGGIAIGGYSLWQIQQLKLAASEAQSSIDNSLSQIRDQNGQLSGQVRASLAADLKQSLNEAKAAKDAASKTEARLDKGLEQMRAMTSTRKEDWQLAEVEYLLRLANQRILTEGTVKGATAMLKSADNILHSLDDVSLYPVRKAVAEDLAKLEAVPSVDTEGLFLRLSALSEQIDNLPLLPVHDDKVLPDVIREVTDDKTAKTWSERLGHAWDNAWTELNQLIVVHHRDTKVKPLMTPQEHFYLQQNLHLMLEQAQLALLQNQQLAYDNSLKKAAEWIPEYFDARHNATQALLDGIHELQQVKVTPALPDISTSLNVLKNYLHNVHDKDSSGNPQSTLTPAAHQSQPMQPAKAPEASSAPEAPAASDSTSAETESAAPDSAESSAPSSATPEADKAPAEGGQG